VLAWGWCGPGQPHGALSLTLSLTLSLSLTLTLPLSLFLLVPGSILDGWWPGSEGSRGCARGAWRVLGHRTLRAPVGQCLLRRHQSAMCQTRGTGLVVLVLVLVLARVLVLALPLGPLEPGLQHQGDWRHRAESWESNRLRRHELWTQRGRSTASPPPQHVGAFLGPLLTAVLSVQEGRWLSVRPQGQK
jgi:hypothetical protein